MKLSTGNITLRALEPEDLDFVYSIENDATMWDVSSVNVPYSRMCLQNYILTNSSDIYADKQLRLVVENTVKQPVGLLDLVNFDPRHSRAEVGIAIHQEFRHKGYAEEALRILINYSRDLLHMHQLYAIIPDDNNVSMHLFKVCGFKKIAVFDDWLATPQGFAKAVFLQMIL